MVYNACPPDTIPDAVLAVGVVVVVVTCSSIKKPRKGRRRGRVELERLGFRGQGFRRFRVLGFRV